MSGDKPPAGQDQDKARADQKRQADAAQRRDLHKARELGAEAGKKAAGEVLRGLPETPRSGVEGMAGLSPVDARKQAEREGRVPYDGLEVKPPKTDQALIPVGEIRIESRAALRGKPAEAARPPDQPLRGERGLSPEERAERQRVAQPANGVGFRHGADRAGPEEMDRWHGALSDAQKRALSDPNAVLFVVVHASRSGSEDVNYTLTERRAQNLERDLRTRYGVRAQIEVHAVGEEQAIQEGRPDGKDNHRDRVATIDIHEKGTRPAVRPPDLKAAEREGKDAGRGLGKLPDKPHRETGADLVREALIHALGEAVGHVLGAPAAPGMVGAMYGHKLLEAHRENKEATEKGARLVGAYYAIDLIGEDAMHSSRHSAEGSQYTQAELTGRLSAARAGAFKNERDWLIGLGTPSGADTARVDRAIARGVQDAVDVANGLIRRFGSAEERRVALLGLGHSVIERIDHERRLRGNELLRR